MAVLLADPGQEGPRRAWPLGLNVYRALANAAGPGWQDPDARSADPSPSTRHATSCKPRVDAAASWIRSLRVHGTYQARRSRSGDARASRVASPVAKPRCPVAAAHGPGAGDVQGDANFEFLCRICTRRVARLPIDRADEGFACLDVMQRAGIICGSCGEDRGREEGGAAIGRV